SSDLSFSFDASVWELFLPLISGGAVVIAKPDGHRDPAYLAELISTAGVTQSLFVPSLLRPFLDEPGAARCTSLRRLFVGAEAFTPELVARCQDVLDVPLVNLYGPTEASIAATHWPLSVDDSGTADGPVP